MLLQKAPKNSLAFLLDAAKGDAFETTFEKELMKRLQRGVELLFSDSFRKGIEYIRGTGFGFTPSGDDFICGLLLGLRVAERIYGVNLSSTCAEIYEASIGDNLISNAFLACAKEGAVFEKIRSLGPCAIR